MKTLNYFMLLIAVPILFISCSKNDKVEGQPLLDVEDYDGNVYKTVQIGNQVWMAENLKVTHYADGTEIPFVTDNAAWTELADNNMDDAYCYYNNNANGEVDIYGALYTWAAAVKGENSSNANPSGVQGVCPTGWHLPSDDELTELINHLGGKDIAGGKLKETGTTYWWNSNTGATNESGFSALPGGLRDAWDGVVNSFYNQGGVGFWWSTTETDFSDSLVWTLNLSSSNPWAEPESLRKSYGISVRCIQN